MTRLFFIRHGKTEWNLEGRYQGSGGDSPLLKESYTEIKALSNYLRHYHFEAVYSSPLKRALVTAQHLAEGLPQQLEVKVDPNLKEFNLGKMEGMKFTDVALRYPQELDAFGHHADLYDPTDIEGETFQQLFDRMTPAIQKIVMNHPTGNVLVVSHGAALCAEIRHLLGYPLSELRARGGLANTSTTILETHNGREFNCLAWNKTEYLGRSLDATDIV
ncbi:histidine phosphatase family protein [Liquorilactobacillus oeni]|uniref:Phosphoglycerate mutase n=1 Tax=Liquorilactobacillus oeni DSM 19972 TaxID=1423777 RepID=A0A0R1M8I4_9LACO|nr:histidine phosphatase family protein [Liquorilactobacillus oeni]KRL04653.1 phosphoglycerate mutase [Liquorilactobacillus oeni DSM 19972]